MKSDRFGQEVRKLRDSLKMTQDEFAFLAGVTTKTISRWEIGENTPTGLSADRLNQIGRLAKTEEGRKKLTEQLPGHWWFDT